MFFLMNFYLMLIMLLTFILFLYFYINNMVMFFEFELMNFLGMKIIYLVLIDWISLLFLMVVKMISLMVIFYSFEYMNLDKFVNRFIKMIYLFILSMILMIISPNIISILLGWDGLGLISYSLVIYYQSSQSFNSGMVTVLMNRVGDILIMISISLMIIFGSWNFMFLNKLNYLIYLLMILISFTKSAQLPFSSWLPMAMAAPTPVSSLVHSSTLVTAGVYLMIRLNYLLNYKILINMIMLFSLLTMFMSGLMANFEMDLKKIIALSTLSQLGLMFFCLSLKLMEVCLFHLVIHAMFKSLLFMCLGVMIHFMFNNQDIRLISMTLFNLPLVSMMFNCAVLSLCGLPFLSGFFSKDLILEMYLMMKMNLIIYIILLISMGLSIMYSFRLIYYSFLKLPNMKVNLSCYNFNSLMCLSMYMLFFFSIFWGVILSWIMFSLKNLIYLPIKLKMMIYLFLILGMMMGMYLPQFLMKMKFLLYMINFINFIKMMWFMMVIYNKMTLMLMNYSEKNLMNLDYGWNEYIMGGMLKKMLIYLYKLEFFSKNYFYLLVMMMVLILIFLF